MRNSEQKAQEKYDLTLSLAEPRGTAAGLLEFEWFRLGTLDCKNNSSLVSPVIALVNSILGLKFLDKKALTDAMPQNLNDEISKLISAKGEAAFKSCSDPQVFTELALTVLPESSYNIALCRCAAAKTGYETFKSALTDFTDEKGYFACAQMGDDDGQPRLVFEFFAYATNLINGKRYACSELKTATENTALKRVDYSSSSKGSARSVISGTYFLPLEGAK